MGLENKISSLEERRNLDIKSGSAREVRMGTDLIDLEKTKLNIVQEFGSASQEEIEAVLEGKRNLFEKELKSFLAPRNVYGPRFNQDEPMYDKLKILHEERLELGKLKMEIYVLEWLNGKTDVDTELSFG